MRINKIFLENFKYAKGIVEIDLRGMNALFLGENGSGKSTIAWALYTFFESSLKDDPAEVQKYFDHNSNQNLINRNAHDADDASITIEFIDDDKTIIAKTISNSTINTNHDLIKEACYASDFLNYRALSRMYDFRNSDYVDLFPVFEKDIIKLIRLEGKTLGDRWDDISKGLDLIQGKRRHAMTSTAYKEFQTKVVDFNNMMNAYLSEILPDANKIIRSYFRENISLKIKLVPASWNDLVPGTKSRSYKITKPKLILTVNYQSGVWTKSDLEKPQTFLNEGRLTQIFLALRLAIVQRRLTESKIRILVLDDMLISLDMSLRMAVMSIIIEKFSDFQLIILTHDRGFYNVVSSMVDSTEWKFIKMLPNNSHMDIGDNKSDLEKAKEFLASGDYDMCGLLLRKSLEDILKKFNKVPDCLYTDFETLQNMINCASNTLQTDFMRNFSKSMYDKSLNADDIELLNSNFDSKQDLPEEKKLRLKIYRKKLVKFSKELYEKQDHAYLLLQDLKKIKDRVFNPSAHDSPDTPLFRAEIEEAITKIDKLRKRLLNIT
jgi:ABC-type dipeptide/oligopeptide/nickel transport system ATPase subunit